MFDVDVDVDFDVDSLRMMGVLQSVKARSEAFDLLGVASLVHAPRYTTTPPFPHYISHSQREP